MAIKNRSLAENKEFVPENYVPGIPANFDDSLEEMRFEGVEIGSTPPRQGQSGYGQQPLSPPAGFGWSNAATPEKLPQAAADIPSYYAPQRPIDSSRQDAENPFVGRISPLASPTGQKRQPAPSAGQPQAKPATQGPKRYFTFDI